MYLSSNPVLTNACILLGLHEALTPLTIMAGAMTLFETMEATNCLAFLVREMKVLTGGHAVAECMLLFAFAYLVEGASGFGTPVALGAPMLVSTGRPPLQSVVVMLLFNTFATVWGAVGTPLWFGFGDLGLTDEEMVEVSTKSAICLVVCSIILIPFILTILIPWPILRKNVVFVYLSLASVMGPAVGLSTFNYEFPALLGGLVGCGLTSLLIKFKVGMMISGETEDDEEGGGGDKSNAVEGAEVVRSNHNDNGKGNDDSYNVSNQHGRQWEDVEANRTATNDSPHMEASMEDGNLGPRKAWKEGYLREMIGRTFPIWGIVVILMLTRIEQIGIKEVLSAQEPHVKVELGTYGTFKLSASLVFMLENILTYPNLNWKYELLYVPFLIPFILVSMITMILYRKEMTGGPATIAKTVARRLVHPAIAICGALILVQLMIRSTTEAPAYILGSTLAGWLRQAFVVLCPLLGALGSFFSGSTTVSNLTFGEIQYIAAESIGVSKTSLLALQTVGASAGNGSCLNNIIAALAVVGLEECEGQILKQTIKVVLAFTTIATVVMLAFFLRFE